MNGIDKLIIDLKKLIYCYFKEYTDYFSLKSFSNKNFNIDYWLKKINSPDSDAISYKLPEYLFKIGNIKIENPIVSAPMAGISDNSYRIIARFFGCSLTFTEMVSSYGIYYDQNKTLSLVKVTPFERPCAVQIFGSEVSVMAEAAKKIEGIADIVDINMGCPVPKILKSKSGGYLLQDEDRIEKIISRLTGILKIPLTIKIRIGWDRNNINVLRIARIAEQKGASAISIHGRTVKQGFSGVVDYKIIKKVKESVKIPVIISGDIDSPRKAKEVLEYTGCDGAMVGRTSKGSMWVFLNTLLFLAGKGRIYKDGSYNPSLLWKKDFSKLYLKYLVYFKGEERAVKEYRKILSWIFKGVTGISRVRREFFRIESFKDAVNLIGNI